MILAGPCLCGCVRQHPRSCRRTQFDRNGPPSTTGLADEAHDAKSLRDELTQRRIKAVIPSNPTSKRPQGYDKNPYKGRNVIVRVFCSRIATLTTSVLTSSCPKSSQLRPSLGGPIESGPYQSAFPSPRIR